ncbi:hypothetical protein [Mesorhizobium sp.]|uniref:hypothetical protein n=1 Tax=Mesorhizobium sp. TaxID=1871066 RepID=UPI000FE78E9E|nr:hypothetical protein [Mesorhizobium sp.]RWI12401.1 MAG: hypothetical protein EOQ90_01685 [Mesorhizobium sp.]RWM86296.1 MAG: hypothetical protein EOR83_08260 [Mesorhizobium sp.]TJW55076.1 MAG: hypothetical protein E5X65_07845 [Mesorhizobium sp.]
MGFYPHHSGPGGGMDLRWSINLLEDGAVVTQEGEYLGTWGIDESDAICEFTPDGAAEPLLCSGFVKFLCDRIEQWHSQQQSGGA